MAETTAHITRRMAELLAYVLVTRPDCNGTDLKRAGFSAQLVNHATGETDAYLPRMMDYDMRDGRQFGYRLTPVGRQALKEYLEGGGKLFRV